TDSNQAEDIFPAGFFVSSGPANPKSTQRGKRKERKNHESTNSVQKITNSADSAGAWLLCACTRAASKRTADFCLAHRRFMGYYISRGFGNKNLRAMAQRRPGIRILQ